MIESHKRIFVTVLFVIITICYGVETGSIIGMVVNENNEAGLKSVNIKLLNTNMGTATTKKGHYRIKDINPGCYQIKFSAIGYKNLVIDSVIIESGGNNID